VWVRVVRGTDSGRLLEVAGLDRADARVGLDDDVQALAHTLAGDRDLSEGPLGADGAGGSVSVERRAE
jgi:hypothetical protein